MTEDVDLTWTFYERGEDVLFVPEAIAYPLEPADLTMLGRQLKRWSHGFIQNLVKHRGNAIQDDRLRSILNVMLWDSVTASLIYLAIVPVLAVLFSAFVYFALLGLLGELAVKASGMHRRSTLDRILNELH